eukprot:XP_010657177.2 PREDICTED: uncharacterized protein LOC104880862 [Vitis vinifera]
MQGRIRKLMGCRLMCHVNFSYPINIYGLGLNTQTRMPEKYQGWEGPSWTQVMGCSTSDQLDLYAACSKFGLYWRNVEQLVLARKSKAPVFQISGITPKDFVSYCKVGCKHDGVVP